MTYDFTTGEFVDPNALADDYDLEGRALSVIEVNGKPRSMTDDDALIPGCPLTSDARGQLGRGSR
jgi:hypothetical protein